MALLDMPLSESALGNEGECGNNLCGGNVQELAQEGAQARGGAGGALAELDDGRTTLGDTASHCQVSTCEPEPVSSDVGQEEVLASALR